MDGFNDESEKPKAATKRKLKRDADTAFALAALAAMPKEVEDLTSADIAAFIKSEISGFDVKVRILIDDGFAIIIIYQMGSVPDVVRKAYEISADSHPVLSESPAQFIC